MNSISFGGFGLILIFLGILMDTQFEGIIYYFIVISLIFFIKGYLRLRGEKAWSKQTSDETCKDCGKRMSLLVGEKRNYICLCKKSSKSLGSEK